MSDEKGKDSVTLMNDKLLFLLEKQAWGNLEAHKEIKEKGGDVEDLFNKTE